MMDIKAIVAGLRPEHEQLGEAIVSLERLADGRAKRRAFATRANLNFPRNQPLPLTPAFQPSIRVQQCARDEFSQTSRAKPPQRRPIPRTCHGRGYANLRRRLSEIYRPRTSDDNAGAAQTPFAAFRTVFLRTKKRLQKPKDKTLMVADV
jgi:hypothetical protein